MIHPSYVELMKVVNDNVEIGEEPVVNSRYSIVAATAKRARQIIDGNDPAIDLKPGVKPLSIAVKELFEGGLEILSEESAEEMEQKLEELKSAKAERRRREEEMQAQQETYEEEAEDQEEDEIEAAEEE